MTPEDALAALRAGGPEAEAARAALLPEGVAVPGERALRRAAVAALLAASLRPTDHVLARWLLEQEIADLSKRGHGATEALYTLVAVVARYADPEDVLLLWHAREATPETRAGMDVEQLARAGVERVRRRLRTLAQTGGPRAHEAACALDWLEEGLAAGAGSDLPGYFAWSDDRFGLHITGPT